MMEGHMVISQSLLKASIGNSNARHFRSAKPGEYVMPQNLVSSYCVILTSLETLLCDCSVQGLQLCMLYAWNHRRYRVGGRGLRIQEAGVLFQVAVALAGLVHKGPQLCQRQLVVLVRVSRLKQLIRVIQCFGLLSHADKNTVSVRWVSGNQECA